MLAFDPTPLFASRPLTRGRGLKPIHVAPSPQAQLSAHIDGSREQAARKRELGTQAQAAIAGILKEIANGEQQEVAELEAMARP